MEKTDKGTQGSAKTLFSLATQSYPSGSAKIEFSHSIDSLNGYHESLPSRLGNLVSLTKKRIKEMVAAP